MRVGWLDNRAGWQVTNPAMARIPEIKAEDHPELGPFITAIMGKRGRLSSLYATLLHSPPMALGWLTFLTAVRREGVLEGRYRELAILRVALLNDAPYEFNAHRSHAIGAGISEEQINALSDWTCAECFAKTDRAVLAYTDAMTRDIKVAGAVHAAVKASFSDREIVELALTVAAYNLVSRFLVALEIGKPSGHD